MQGRKREDIGCKPDLPILSIGKQGPETGLVVRPTYLSKTRMDENFALAPSGDTI